MREEICWRCHGEGKIKKDLDKTAKYDCPVCGGNGRVVVENDDEQNPDEDEFELYWPESIRRIKE